MHQPQTTPKKKLVELIFDKQLHNKDHIDYKRVREFMDLLFAHNIIKGVHFEIQETHVNCTIDFIPAAFGQPKVFMQDSVSNQSWAGGKTEQEAFLNALSKISVLL